jgi:poly(A) polymerase Pap1
VVHVVHKCYGIILINKIRGNEARQWFRRQSKDYEHIFQWSSCILRYKFYIRGTQYKVYVIAHTVIVGLD